MREASTVREMTKQWIRVEDALELQIDSLVMEVMDMQERGEVISPSKLFRLERYQRLLAQTQAEFAKYVENVADPDIASLQAANATAGLRDAITATQLSYLPSGTVGVSFATLPVDAVQNLVGIAGDGQPLGDLLWSRMVRAPDGTPIPGVIDGLTDALLQGVAQGKNPRAVARAMSGKLAGGLNKALVIARTEGLRPYRQAASDQYAASGVVIGMRRLTAHDGRVCAACIADEGTLYSVHEIIPDHPQGRCTSVPVVRNQPIVQWTMGEDWFNRQPDATQKSIMGNSAWKAWNEGVFEFKDMITRTDDATWGKGLVPSSLSKLLKEAA